MRILASFTCTRHEYMNMRELSPFAEALTRPSDEAESHTKSWRGLPFSSSSA